MKVLNVGSGGREHATVEGLAKSSLVAELACSPGSDAIGEVRLASNGELVRRLPFGVTDAKAIADYAKDARFDLVTFGPEAAIDAGLGDHCRKYGVPFAGPCSRGARIEISKEIRRTN